MTDETERREKLRKIEALFAGDSTPLEQSAAETALERVKARPAERALRDRAGDRQFSLSNE